MNKAFEIIDNEVIVTDDLGYETTRDITNNIEEILITENNIEEIEKLINHEKNKLFLNSSTAPLSFLGWGTAHTILSISKFINNKIDYGMIYIISGTLFLMTGTLMSIGPSKNKKIINKKINHLEEKLYEEQIKLNELEDDKTNDATCICPDEKKLSTSIKIEILKDRLKDIEFYMRHKNKIIKLYKKGILEEELFEGCASRDTINFIIKLVENDLGIQNTNEKNKTNVKKLNK